MFWLSRNKLRSEERRVGKECRFDCDWSSDVCSSDLLAVAFDQPRCADHDCHCLTSLVLDLRLPVATSGRPDVIPFHTPPSVGEALIALLLRSPAGCSG